jgi:transcription antitermination factor NusG
MLHLLTTDGFIEFRGPADEERPSRWVIGIAAAGREYAICQRIEENEDFGIYLPIEVKQRRAGRNRLANIVVPLIRPYFFVPASITDEQYHHIKNTPGVFDFLQIDGRLAVIRDRELDRARLQEFDSEQKRLRRILGRGSSEHFAIDEPVRIDVGFTSFDATVHSIKGRKIEVDLGPQCLLFGKRIVEVDLAHIKRGEVF